MLGWVPAPSSILAVGYHRLIEAVFVTCFAGYMTWTVGHDMRQAFGRLSDEYKSIEESKEEVVRLSKADFLTGLVNVKQAKINYETLLSALRKSIVFSFTL